jgi:hypothetical protein
MKPERRPTIDRLSQNMYVLKNNVSSKILIFFAVDVHRAGSDIHDDLKCHESRRGTITIIYS